MRWPPTGPLAFGISRFLFGRELLPLQYQATNALFLRLLGTDLPVRLSPPTRPR